MRMLTKLLLFACFFTVLSPTRGFSQLKTWIQTSGGQENLTNVLSTNQVMEILSVSMDISSQIDVHADNKTVSFGGEADNLAQPSPFVIAGPATVVFRRTETGSAGGFITYRINTENASQKPSQAKRE